VKRAKKRERGKTLFYERGGQAGSRIVLVLR